MRYLQLGYAAALVLALTGTAALPQLVCADSPSEYGTDARAGREGRSGRSGRSGSSQTVWATGEPVNLNLSGEDGEAGGDGESASQPWCGSQPTADRNVSAADGADGGEGGSGGTGGSGGDVMLYYTDPAQLRQVYIAAVGGQGGRGGRGGRATLGCRCEDDRWQIETCVNGTCTTREYRCTDGRDGRDGRDGQQGQDGRLGQLSLVNQSEPIPAEVTTQRLAIATFPTAPVRLSRNLWETRTGAAALLAPGSTVNNTYREYVGHVEGDFQLVWDSAVPQQSAPGSLTLEIDRQGQVSAVSDGDLWVGGEASYADGLTTYRVTGAVRASDATRLDLGRSDGQHRSFTLNVLDLAQQSQLVNTQFYVRYRTARDERRPRYITRYEGEVPSDLVSQNYNQFTLAIGRLPIEGPDLTRGTPTEIELVITRSYAGRSAQQTLTWRGDL